MATKTRRNRVHKNKTKRRSQRKTRVVKGGDPMNLGVQNPKGETLYEKLVNGFYGRPTNNAVEDVNNFIKKENYGVSWETIQGEHVQHVKDIIDVLINYTNNLKEKTEKDNQYLQDLQNIKEKLNATNMGVNTI